MGYLVTGCAGFIGFHLCELLLEQGERVFGVDNLNDYYSVELKKRRLERLELHKGFSFRCIDIADKETLREETSALEFSVIVNLAAQAGVRYSISNPSAYIQSNLVGFANILELAREHRVQNLVYASSSSVYGGSERPNREDYGISHPLSLYAATKRSNELMAHSYSNLFGVPTIGLRFFTVYGPWGRPDMALYLFADALTKGQPLRLYNNGEMIRDFTYVSDIVKAVYALCKKPPIEDKTFRVKSGDEPQSWCPFRVFNIGNSKPVRLMDYVKALEDELGIRGKYEMMGMQDGDVSGTESDCRRLYEYIGYRPNTEVKAGIKSFVNWYKEYNGIS